MGGLPEQLQGGTNLGFMFLPIYRGWVIIASLIICTLASVANSEYMRNHWLAIVKLRTFPQ